MLRAASWRLLGCGCGVCWVRIFRAAGGVLYRYFVFESGRDSGPILVRAAFVGGVVFMKKAAL